jgi:hypothetical protein
VSAYVRIHKDGAREEVRRPRAFHDDANRTPVDDAWLIANDGVYPVREPESIDPLADPRPVDEWELHTDHVLKTYAPLAPRYARARLRDKVATLRWRVETGGVVAADQVTHTDATSQAKILGAFVAQQQGWIAAEGLNWKRGGVFARSTPSDIQAMAQMVFGFVQACYDREAELLAQIDAALDLDALRAIDVTTGWPANAAISGEAAWASL